MLVSCEITKPFAPLVVNVLEAELSALNAMNGEPDEDIAPKVP